MSKKFEYRSVFSQGYSEVSLFQTPTADSVKPTEDVFKMIKENRAPAELIDLIAEKLGVSDGTPSPTSIDHVYEIDGREYLIVNEDTADEHVLNYEGNVLYLYRVY